MLQHGAPFKRTEAIQKATNARIAQWCHSRPAFRIDPLAAACGEPVVREALSFALEHIDIS
jgi:hypothetical protein